jgi:hypothetical protein
MNGKAYLKHVALKVYHSPGHMVGPGILQSQGQGEGYAACRMTHHPKAVHKNYSDIVACGQAVDSASTGS